jgi:hypothetical protein
MAMMIRSVHRVAQDLDRFLAQQRKNAGEGEGDHFGAS